MLKSLGVILLAALGATVAQAKPAVYQKTGSISLKSLWAWKAAEKDPRLNLPAAENAVDLYRVAYQSVDFKGQPVILSGLLAIPQGGAPNGLVVYFHGTTVDRLASPSYFPKYWNLEARLAVQTFATGGYALAMPDYIGLGVDIDHVHPYPYGDVNSRSGIDMIGAAEETGANVGEPISPKLFVAGYSEGGAVAMCALRHLEESPLAGTTLICGAPMSGPYDLSGVTAKSLLAGGQSLPDLAIKLYLLGFSFYSALENLSLPDLTPYLAPSFASYVPFVFSQNPTDEQAATKLLVKGLEMGAIHSVSRVLQPAFRQALEKGDKSQPYMAELQKNDCYDWKPTAPMLLPYLTTDNVVAPQNTLEAVEAMRARGVSRDLVRPDPIVDSSLNHITAAPIALVEGRRFFDSFLKGKSPS